MADSLLRTEGYQADAHVDRCLVVVVGDTYVPHLACADRCHLSGQWKLSVGDDEVLLRELSEALHHLELGHTRGKIVIVM